MMPDRSEIGPIERHAFAGKADRLQRAIDEGHDIDYISGTGFCPLHCAVYQGHYEICLILLKNGADVNLLSVGEGTALDLAYRFNHPDVVELLKAWGGVTSDWGER